MRIMASRKPPAKTAPTATSGRSLGNAARPAPAVDAAGGGIGGVGVTTVGVGSGGPVSDGAWARPETGCPAGVSEGSVTREGLRQTRDARSCWPRAWTRGLQARPCRRGVPTTAGASPGGSPSSAEHSIRQGHRLLHRLPRGRPRETIHRSSPAQIVSTISTFARSSSASPIGTRSKIHRVRTCSIEP